MSSVLRSVRKRKKGRTLSAVDVIDREGYAELEVDAKVELNSAGVDAHRGIARRGSDRAGWRTLRPQRPVSRRAPSWEQSRDGRVGRPARADSRAPDSPCHGARDVRSAPRRLRSHHQDQRRLDGGGVVGTGHATCANVLLDTRRESCERHPRRRTPLTCLLPLNPRSEGARNLVGN